MIDKYLLRIQKESLDLENYSIDNFFSRLEKAIKNKNLESKTLGFSREKPILFLYPKELVDKPRVMISAGFHGDEPSGPWAILNFLEKEIYPTAVNLSLLPLANPTGFKLSRRSNFWGVTPNRGYVKSYDKSPSSHEDNILKDNLTLLVKHGKNCLVTLHEDAEVNFYLWVYGKKNSLIVKLMQMGKEKFGLVPRERLKLGGFNSEEDGLRTDDFDGSFEHAMYKNGVEISITTENPDKVPFEERIDLYTEIVKEVCKSKYYKGTNK